MRRRELKTVIGVGVMLWAAVTQAGGITPPTPQQIAALQAQQAAAAAAKKAYYAISYPNEIGPPNSCVGNVPCGYDTYDAAAKDAIQNIWAWHLWNTPPTTPRLEYGTVIYKDSYQRYWWTRPKAGGATDTGQHVPIGYDDVLRPHSIIEASVHNHPTGDRWPDPNGDNLTPWREYVIRPVDIQGDDRGVIWFLKACAAVVPDADPTCHQPKIFGGVDGGLTIVTKYKYYSDVEGPADLYQVADLGAASPGEGTIWIPIITAAGIAAAAVIGVVFFGVLPAPGGGGSFSNDHCGTISGGGVDGEFVCW